MSGRFLILLLVVSAFLTQCARPKYIQDAGSQTQSDVKPDKTEPDAKSDKTETSEGETSDPNIFLRPMVCKTKMLVSGNCLVWYWENKPTSRQPGTLIFKLYRLNAFDQTPMPMDPKFPPEVILWMPSMGHGSVPTQTQRLDMGTYRASNVFFIMPGEWEIRFQTKENNIVIDGVTVAISI